VLAAGVPGVVARAAAPGALWEKAAGIADLEGRVALTPRHRFRIGSVTKVFVATVVLQLVGEGVLMLDDKSGRSPKASHCGSS
jgi:D-alanyl-D-alanine carboxypeptidase